MAVLVAFARTAGAERIARYRAELPRDVARRIGGGVIALVIAAWRGRLRNQMFAYAPAIAIGCVFALLK